MCLVLIEVLKQVCSLLCFSLLNRATWFHAGVRSTDITIAKKVDIHGGRIIEMMVAIQRKNISKPECGNYRRLNGGGGGERSGKEKKNQALIRG